MRYNIASFNVRNLSADASKERLDNIAKIIKENQLELVALQEVLSEGKILTGMNVKSVSGQAKAYEHSLKSRLGDDWAICWRDPGSWAKNYLYDDARGEGYAFLWNTRKFELMKEDGEEIWPKIYRHYKLREPGMLRLIREPCYGRFRIVGRNIEIRLLNTHMVYGKPASWKGDADFDIGALQMRRNEFRILAGQIYPEIATYHKDEVPTVPYTFILGDYNLNLAGSGVNKAILPDIICFDQYGREVPYNPGAPTVVNTVQTSLSTLKKDEDGLASNYDHFSFENRVASIIEPDSVKTIDIINRVEGEGSKYEIYKKNVSDHLPIMMTIDV